ncbi:hypothetical protein [Anaerobranca gottschalkii]|uniref:Uncharacterized protein n=1 Tax=Anaerobranca gottschalkii DSM 13577 TaxID=1120990 RepID=A0A1H9YII0_9FIRM|nr:hypothetical protein [Anaerobranca gottschalkii]SES68871.1 hypothetical protein SAMN03080614_100353 [Anaerobranca gottschalkii DSM 13577]
MNFVLILLVFIVLLIDFLSFHKHQRKTLYVYGGLVFLILAISLFDKFEVFSMSPLETLLIKMEPVVEFISRLIQKL